MEKILNAIDLPISWKSAEGVYLGGNQSFLDLLCFESLEQLQHKTDDILFNRTFSFRNKQKDREVLLKQEAVLFQAEVGLWNGQVFYLIKTMPFELIQGAVLLSVWSEIDGLKRRELKYAKERKQMNQIIALLPGHVYWLDKDNIYLGCNNEQAKTLGLVSRESIVGKTNIDLPWASEAELLDKMNLKVMNSGKVQEKEETVFIEGQARVYLSKKVPLMGDHQEVEGILGVSIDVTERKRMEVALVKAKNEAERAARAKTEFLANMSHDIRTPLVGMIGLSEYLCEQMQDEPLKKIASQMLELSQGLLEISNSLIEASQAESGNLPLFEDIFSLKKLLRGVASLLEPTIIAKGLVFEVNFREDLPDYWVADERRIRRIMINLISNSIKFTQRGSIKVSFGLEYGVLKKGSDNLLFEVEDTGIGVPKNKQREIFKRFSRLSPSYEAKYKGFGIGLSIVDQFVKDLKGNIQVGGEEGKGAIFTVRLPIKKPTSVQLKLLSKDIKETLKIFDYVQLKLKVLVVEDNKIAGFLVLYLLEKLDFNVDLADSAEKAAQLIFNHHYDFILTDLGLPEKDGYWIAEMIRANEKTLSNKKRSVIIGLSAHLGQGEEKRCQEAGMDGCILKPLTEQKLSAILRTHFSSHGEQCEETEPKNVFEEWQPSFEPHEPEKEEDLNRASDENIKVIDIQGSARNFYSNNLQASQRMLSFLLEGLPNEKKRMNKAFKAYDWKKLLHVVHNFYGGCVSCGVPRLTRAVGLLKNALSQKLGKGEGSDEQIMALYEQMMVEMDAVIKAAEKIEGEG